MAKHYIRGNYIWVAGTIDGVYRRYSTKRLATDEEYLFYIKSAKNAAKVLLQLHCQNADPYKASENFKDFALSIVENKKSSITKGTYNDLISRLNRYLFPTFKNYRLDQLKRQDVKRWLSHMFSITTQDVTRRSFVLLKEIMTEAYLSDMIEKNPCEKIRDIKLKRKSPKPKEPYTIEEVEKILQNAKGWLRTYLIVSFFTGLRIGDILNLKWSQIDLSKRVIELKISKTDDYITIEMVDYVYEALKAHRSQKRCDLLFPNRNNKPFSRSEPINTHYFKPLLKELGIEYKDLYTTRHTFASLLINGGADIPWVSKMLSHAHIETTLKHYNKFLETKKDRIGIANNIIRTNLKINKQKEGK